ncbi:hypothetical protein BgAZ_102680 [Babesia gibsoni]|uniref:Uncharacterized protein n=1 Tax=Babesia gibsoni TaxID=33632 RepID=A0AAD8PFG3_BABGI|nr:hypothetical protein BgAZ_102680 [Babesia gibsoni]
MKNESRVIFSKICRLPSNYANKSIFKNHLGESPQTLLRQVAESKVTSLSPIDTAAILKSLIEGTNYKGISELRKYPLYRPVAKKLVDSIECYRQELLSYFVLQFYKLHDIQAIKALSRLFLQREAWKSQNLSQLVEFLYYLAHHIPKEIRASETVNAEQLLLPEKEEPTEDVNVYCEILLQLQGEVLRKVKDLRDTTLLYKLITSLSNLPKTKYTSEILASIKDIVKVELEKNNWSGKHLKRVIVALIDLKLVDSYMLTSILRTLEYNQDSFDSCDIKDLLEALDIFDIQACNTYISLRDKLEIANHIRGKMKSLEI